MEPGRQPLTRCSRSTLDVFARTGRAPCERTAVPVGCASQSGTHVPVDVTGALALHDEVGFLRHKRHRAGRSAERIWRENRRKALRGSWRLIVASAALVAFCVFMIVFTDGFGELLMAGVIGAITTIHVVVWSLGGHVSSLSWMRGVWGEHDTEDVLDKLGPGWVVEHDIDRQWGTGITSRSAARACS